MENDDVTLEIRNKSVTVYKNGTRFGTIGAINVVNAFVDQDEIVLEYCDPRLNLWRYQTYDFSLHGIRSGGGKYKLKRRARHRSSINSDSNAGQARKFGGLSVGLTIFLLVVAWAIFSPAPPTSKTTSPLTFDDGMDSYKRGDYARAIEAWRPLAERGDTLVQTNLGVLYGKGQGVEKNDKMAAHWFKKAADQGFDIAQFNLGVRYHKGLGVKQDDRQAVELFRKAAEQGHVEATYNLGAMYMNGFGVPQDYTQAMKWFLMAAEHGVTDAQYYIGLMFKNGWGVERDDKQAEKWLSQAAEKGNSLASNALLEFRK